jgi:hypothetical protein
MVTTKWYRASLNVVTGALIQLHTPRRVSSVTQSTAGIASITDVTISDVHSRQQHERKRVSVHNTVKQRHNTYV